jgi:exo-1,4-beta-D-glucosaminidase
VTRNADAKRRVARNLTARKQSAGSPLHGLAALVKDEVYLDPYFGKNLHSIPGTSYPIGTESFMLTPMSPESPSALLGGIALNSRFPLPSGIKRYGCTLNGVNYRANMWLNGRQIANSAEMVGTWRVFEFDVTKSILPGNVTSLVIGYPFSVLIGQLSS